VINPERSEGSLSALRATGVFGLAFESNTAADSKLGGPARESRGD
jgi:hypothetical protein